MKYSLAEIKQKVDGLAYKINAPVNLLPSYGQESVDAHPYIEVDGIGFMHYIISERGQDLERSMTHDIDDLLYTIFSGITFRMGSQFEINNRIEGQDTRRISFAKQIELLNHLNPSWGGMEDIDHQRILKNHPFDDLASLRASYFSQLRQQGVPEGEINKRAYEKYPSPNS